MALTKTQEKHEHDSRILPRMDYASSSAVIFWLLMTLISFYCVFYVIASLVHGIFKLKNFDGTIPFHYKSYEAIFTNSTKWESQPFISDFIALECTYFFSTFVFLVFLRDRLWDFAITVTIIHCAITCAVNVSFPLVWEWWICILSGLVITIAFGQLINQILHLKKTGSFSLGTRSS
ncbi:transmembrane protein 244-like [Asterias rubens]|uniref:transmembrane protein 244-like n=1 Tax=Asterias rubens TaxID=7604 RepID=UPI001455A670|nr:transmembrane protein 244-like [Asterias rubens]